MEERGQCGERRDTEKMTLSLLIYPRALKQEEALRTHRWTQCGWRMEDDTERSQIHQHIRLELQPESVFNEF